MALRTTTAHLRRAAAPLFRASTRSSSALSIDTINPAVKEAQYAVRGELYLKVRQCAHDSGCERSAPRRMASSASRRAGPRRPRATGANACTPPVKATSARGRRDAAVRLSACSREPRRCCVLRRADS